jgi:hypothetical protein
MPHNIESARATVLEPNRPDDVTPMRNPVSHVHIVGALISGFVLLNSRDDRSGSDLTFRLSLRAAS